MLLENNIDSVQNDLDEMQPRDRVNALLQFMKFVIPTQKAIELEIRERQEEKNEYDTKQTVLHSSSPKCCSRQLDSSISIHSSNE